MALRNQSIVMHKEEDGDHLSFLGFTLQDGERWVLSEKKFWRLTLALRWISTLGRRCSGRQMQRILDHIVAAATLRREFLSIVHSCYAFAQKVGDHQMVPLWRSAREELRAVLAALPLRAAPLR